MNLGQNGRKSGHDVIVNDDSPLKIGIVRYPDGFNGGTGFNGTAGDNGAAGDNGMGPSVDG